MCYLKVVIAKVVNSISSTRIYVFQVFPHGIGVFAVSIVFCLNMIDSKNQYTI